MKKLLLPLLAAHPLLHAQLPVSPGAELTLASEGFKFTEGPAADAQGNVYFTDQPNDSILKWSVETGKTSEFLKPAGRSNGLFFTPEGKLIACVDENGELWSLDPASKEVTVLLSGYDGKLFNGPNDVWVDPGGGMYFTDPFYKRPYWEGREKPEQEKQRVYFLPKGAGKPVVAEDTLKQPNGIIGTADGKTLFIADIGSGRTYRYKIGADHSLGEKELFCEMGSDGMTLDAAGNLYLTGKGVTVFDKNGVKLGEIPVPEGWTANVAFGGKEMKTLFITAMDSLYTLEMSVQGSRGADGRK
ncbi:SMP-30/gluconolactonase/LRE family protein [Luteolibacter algae]|uniref:SMP-30/gluconolactonase/LRE family protein n=1 Tax=Luteolibacter algae TaxID=454151 RepID=A0ABW5D606_9BACT